ncbi:hypothetical protein D3C76_1170500 [compost metagenome]
MPLHVQEDLLEHVQIQPRHPAKTLKPGQETPCGNGAAVGIEQAREHLVVQHTLQVVTGHYRLEEQLEVALLKRLIQQRVPGMVIVAHSRGLA